MKRNRINIIIITTYTMFLIISLLINFKPGKEIGNNFIIFLFSMLKILPCAFIMIGLFEVWVKKETVEKHLGRISGIKGYLWAILLAGTTVGGLYVAFPVAYSLHKKGASLQIILTYISASAVCRIPMTIFEASFLGLRFTLIRFLTALPLIIFSSILLGNYLEKKNYRLSK